MRNEKRNDMLICDILVTAAASVRFIHSMDSDAHLNTARTTQKLVFIFLIAPDNTSATSKDAEAAMLELLKSRSVASK